MHDHFIVIWCLKTIGFFKRGRASRKGIGEGAEEDENGTRVKRSKMANLADMQYLSFWFTYQLVNLFSTFSPYLKYISFFKIRHLKSQIEHLKLSQHFFMACFLSFLFYCLHAFFAQEKKQCWLDILKLFFGKGKYRATHSTLQYT